MTKQVTCEGTASENGPTCIDVFRAITPNLFRINVVGNNAHPDLFFGSSRGTVVTSGPGFYKVFEDDNTNLVAEAKEKLGDSVSGPLVSFTGNCKDTGIEATGTLAVGDSQSCNIDNFFIISNRPDR